MRRTSTFPREEDRMLLAPVRLHLPSLRVDLPHPETKLDVDATADPPDPPDLDVREELLADEHRGREPAARRLEPQEFPLCAPRPPEKKGLGPMTRGSVPNRRVVLPTSHASAVVDSRAGDRPGRRRERFRRLSCQLRHPPAHCLLGRIAQREHRDDLSP